MLRRNVLTIEKTVVCGPSPQPVALQSHLVQTLDNQSLPLLRLGARLMGLRRQRYLLT